MKVSSRKHSELLTHGILLACLAHVALSLSFREARIESAVVNAAAAKGLQTGRRQMSQLEELQTRAQKVQEELSKLSSDDIEGYMKVQEDLSEREATQLEEAPVAHTHDSDTAVFENLAASAATTSKDEPDVEEEEEKNVDLGAGAGGLSAISARPNLGKEADVISFGLFAKTFYGVNLKAYSFTVDLLMTAKWMDPRVVALIPQGMDNYTLSKKESEQNMWLPGLVITNRDINKYDLISTAVMVNRKGEVFKVERAMATIKNMFKLNDFPYDRQKLVVKIASRDYMIDDVVLKPAETGNGAEKGLLDGECYTFVDVGASAVKDIDGALKKSRGLLTITVDRELDKYTQSHLIPAGLVTMISWGVFWFPFVAPFITPRLALSILTLLSFTQLMLKSSDALPPGAPYNWNDLLNLTILSLIFFTVCLNILSEVCFHQLKVEDVARTVNYECKILTPAMSLMSIGLILSAAGRDGWMSLAATSIVVNIFLACILGLYSIHVVSRSTKAFKEKEAHHVAQMDEYTQHLHGHVNKIDDHVNKLHAHVTGGSSLFSPGGSLQGFASPNLRPAKSQA